MSYDDDELMEEKGFRLNDDDEDTDPIEDMSDFGFEEGEGREI